MEDQKPLYAHDCDTCKFLGTFNGKDLYYCSQVVGFETVISRESSDSGDYTSGMVLADKVLELGVAKFIAKTKGFIK